MRYLSAIVAFMLTVAGGTDLSADGTPMSFPTYTEAFNVQLMERPSLEERTGTVISISSTFVCDTEEQGLSLATLVMEKKFLEVKVLYQELLHTMNELDEAVCIYLGKDANVNVFLFSVNVIGDNIANDEGTMLTHYVAKMGLPNGRTLYFNGNERTPSSRRAISM